MVNWRQFQRTINGSAHVVESALSHPAGPSSAIPPHPSALLHFDRPGMECRWLAFAIRLGIFPLEHGIGLVWALDS